MKNLRKRREAAGLSRFQLALLSGVSPDTIEGIELRDAGTTIKTAKALAKALRTTVADLIGEKAVAS